MVRKIENGQISKWLPPSEYKAKECSETDNFFNADLNFSSKPIYEKSWYREFGLIFKRFIEEMWRDQVNSMIPSLYEQ